MKGTAINKIPNKIFAIFAVQLGQDMLTCPETIARRFENMPSDVFVLPWEGPEFTVNFNNRDSLQLLATELSTIVEKIEPCDPWVKSTFGVEGICEGIVYVPGAGATITRKQYSDLTFKAKGEKHKVVKTKEAVQVDPEIVASVDEFVKMFVTEARLEQGLSAIGGTVDLKQTGVFLKWISTDILKESVDELEVSGLEWDQVVKTLQQTAKAWFLNKSKVL